jgi:NAD(P)-dependent dehydrogenase (short-subunit alcohol dehydrogenase family)
MASERFTDQVVLVSGGAGGIGRAASLLFAAEGARVAIADLQSEAGHALAAEIETRGGEALFNETDVSKAEQVHAAVEATLARFGRIDILFNHAGTVIVKPFLDTTEEDWDRLMAINVKSMFLMSRAVLPAMLAQGKGVIVNTASISAVTASPLESLYCTTKGAVLQLTRALAVEFRERGIRCNAVCPGFIRTPHGLREIKELGAYGFDVEKDITAFQGRIGEPDHVARAVLYLASDDASFVNGSALFVDNAWTAIT